MPSSGPFHALPRQRSLSSTTLFGGAHYAQYVLNYHIHRTQELVILAGLEQFHPELSIGNSLGIPSG